MGEKADSNTLARGLDSHTEATGVTQAAVFSPFHNVLLSVSWLVF